QGTATVSQALLAGTVDCGINAPLTLAKAIDTAGLQPVLIGSVIGESPQSFHPYWATRADSSIKTVQDLKGKTVAVNTIGSQVDLFTRAWLRHNGLDPDKDVSIVEVPFPIGLTALKRGQVDAIVLVQPFAAKAEKEGGIRRLGDIGQVLPSNIELVEACRRQALEAHPKAIAQFAKDFAAASDRFQTHHEASIELISEVTKLPAPVLQSFMFTDKDFHRWSHGAIDVSVVQHMFDLFYDNGALKKRLKAQDYVQPGVTIVAQ
ncbi:MAG TPA: ABC transporter substrate-binding protein, partial [Nevskiaceae bacterium]